MIHFIYILKCSDNTLYCGYTNNLYKRIYSHNFSKKAAKYTRIRRPVNLIYFEIFEDKSKALSREFEIKKLNRKQKIGLLYFNKVSFSTSARLISL